MQYRDVYHILPNSYEWRHISPSNYYITKDVQPDIYVKDYKTPYKYSQYFLRRLVPLEKNIHKTINQDISTNNLVFEKMNNKTPAAYEYYKNANYKRLNHEHFIKKAENEDDNSSNKFNNIQYDQSKIQEFVKGMIMFNHTNHAQPKSLMIKDTAFNATKQYINAIEVIGYDKSLDAFDGCPEWQQIYFENLQYLHDMDEDLRDNHDYKKKVYVGRTKKWQVLDDLLGKTEVDKVQAAIGAPVQGQLDIWEEENNNKYIQMPVCNENQEKFRDRPEHYKSFDHNYNDIVYKRARDQHYEKLRNTRYWNLPGYHDHPSNFRFNDAHPKLDAYGL